MSVLPFLLVTGIGAILALLTRSRARVAAGLGAGALLAAVVAAAAIRPGDAWSLGGTDLIATGLARTFLMLGSVVALALTVVGAAAGSRRDSTAVALTVLGTSAIALSASDIVPAVLAASAGGAATALLALVPASGRSGATVGLRVLRATIVAAAMAIVATAWLGGAPSGSAVDPVVAGLAFGAVALAAAIRFGAIPFHAWAARLTDAVPEAELPLVTGWSAAAFALVVLGWIQASFVRPGIDPGAVSDLLVLVALVSIVLGTVAALVQDDLEHVVGYSIVGDAGVVLLGLAALTPDVTGPATTWILVFVVARSAFAAWAAAARTTYFTGRVGDLRGWAVRSPLLGATFGLVVVASVGVPGFAGFDARSSLVDLAFDGLAVPVVAIATLAPLAYYGRLLLVGLARPQDDATRVAVLRPVVPPLDREAMGSWVRTTWRANRALVATATAGFLSALAAAVMVGLVGVPVAG